MIDSDIFMAEADAEVLGSCEDFLPVEGKDFFDGVLISGMKTLWPPPRRATDAVATDKVVFALLLAGLGVMAAFFGVTAALGALFRGGFLTGLGEG